MSSKIKLSVVIWIGFISTSLLLAILAGGAANGAEAAEPTGSWTVVDPLMDGRWRHSAVKLLDGRVMVVGGTQLNDPNITGLTGVELYDPVTKSWTATASLDEARIEASASVLQDGSVLVTGGRTNGPGSELDSALLYDPGSQSWNPTGSMNYARYLHAATRLNDGQLLVTGGFTNTDLSSAELYNPISQTWSTTTPMNNPRNSHSLTLLADGRALVVGGYHNGWLADAEIYDPTGQSWTTTFPNYCHGTEHTVTPLADGRVMILGGACNGASDKAELFDPADDTWQEIAPLPGARFEHTATLLQDGKVLVTGGSDGLERKDDAFLYHPVTATWTTVPSMSAVRKSHSATLLDTGDVLVVGGLDAVNTPLDSAELFVRPELKHKIYLPLVQKQLSLNDIAYRSFLYFWQEANPQTGLIKDRANNFGEDNYTVASTAAVGFGLAALCIGQERGWITSEQAFERTLTTLRFFRDEMEQVHGFYYHFVDLNSGERVWDSEISSIDTALFLAGALVSATCFPDSEVETIANDLYERTDFEWIRTDGGSQPDQLLLGHGWTPETGFLPYRWDTYSELMILYLLALGSPTHPIPAESWTAWSRPLGEYAGFTTFTQGSLFTHQYSQAFVDFRDRRDTLGFNYFTSSINATLANRQFAIDQKHNFKTYDEHIWGITASDGPDGYMAYSAPPGVIDHDGTVSPAAPAGSIVFTPDLSTTALRTMYDRYGHHIWGRYGFSGGFNVDQNWYDPDVIGIDLGITLLMLQNHKNDLVWRLMMQHPAIQTAMDQAGFQPE